MPNRSELPERIGQEVENQLSNLLGSMSLAIDKTDIIPEDLRLMNRGEQYGLDVNWVIHFSDMGKNFNWYFEAKGHGFSEYKRNSRHMAFHIKLIADKLLKSLTLHSRDIHCWCLFIPYISCDEGDLIEIKQLEEYFPFKLVIWDKNFLYQKLPHINKELFESLYFLDQVTSDENPQIRELIKNNIKISSYEGLFWNKVQKQYFSIRRSILDDCKKRMIFDSEQKYVFSEKREIPRSFETKYKFIFEDDEFIANQEDLSNASNIEGVKKLFAGAINTQSVSLISKLKDFLDKEENPYLQITLEHRSGEYRNFIPYFEINSSTNFGCTVDKPTLIKVEET